MQPIQQHGLRMPSLSSVRTRSTCCCLVSGFFTEMVQHIHSLRASGVRSSHAASASASAARVVRKSSGKSWTTPPEITLSVIYKMALSRKDWRSQLLLQFANLLPCRIVARQGRAAGPGRAPWRQEISPSRNGWRGPGDPALEQSDQLIRTKSREANRCSALCLYIVS